MTRHEIKILCESLGWVLGSSYRQGWVVLSCPLARWNHGGGKDQKPSFGIRIDDARIQCVCLSCDWAGSLTDLFTELVVKLPTGTPERKLVIKIMNGIAVTKLREPMLKPVTTEKAKSDPYFTDTWLNSFPKVGQTETGMTYLLHRKISADDAKVMDIRFDPLNKRVCFPIRDWDGSLRGMQGRATDETEPKYLFYKFQGVSCGREVMLGEQVVDPSKPLILVEGVFDYAALFPFTKQVMVLWGCHVNAQRIKRLSRCMKLYTAFDNDKAGSDARARLMVTSLNVVNLNISTTVKDVGELSEEGLKSLASTVDSYGKLG